MAGMVWNGGPPPSNDKNRLYTVPMLRSSREATVSESKDFNGLRVGSPALMPIGVSRGFAFVEFNRVSDAQKWMETKKVKRCWHA